MDQEREDYADDGRQPGWVPWLQSMALPIAAALAFMSVVSCGFAFYALSRR